MLRLKNVIRITGCFAITVALLFSFNIVTHAALLGWDLVDSTKHLDWNGNSDYTTSINNGIGLWNGYKSGVIRKSISGTPDVYVSDYYEVSSTLGYCSPDGYICFNDYKFVDMTSGQRTKTCAHEFGHALGLDHTYGSTDIMQTGKIALTSLSSTDKSSYDAAYATY